MIPFSFQKLNSFGFFINRLVRIFPTYMIGLTCSLLALYVSTVYFTQSWPFSTKEIFIHYVPGIRDIVWSRNIDGIIWTLEIEMKFYFLCALLAYWFQQRRMYIFLIPFFLFLLNIFLKLNIFNFNLEKTDDQFFKLTTMYSTNAKFLIYIFIGVAFHFFYVGRLSVFKTIALVSLLFISFWGCWWLESYQKNWHQVLAYVLALVSFAFLYRWKDRYKQNLIINFIADISYSLYVFHGICGYVFLRIILDKAVHPWMALFLLFIFCLFFSWLLYVTVERPTHALARKVGAQVTALMSKK